MKNNIRNFILLIALILSVSNAFAQSTAFTYQGKLTDASFAANGLYDFKFSLYDSNGTLLVTGTINGVQVTAGIFTVNLDFGPTLFVSNTANSLEISVRPGGTGAYTTLAPRHLLTAIPFAIKATNATSSDSLSATCVSCVTDGQIVAIAGSKVTGTVNNATSAVSATTATSAGYANNAGSAMTAAVATDASNATQLGGIAATQYLTIASGNASYIRNSTSPQVLSNFNVSGTGTANIFTASTQFNIGGQRMLSSPGAFNTFVGVNAGRDNSTGGNNVFVGYSSGIVNTTGEKNSFFGTNAGQQNSTGSSNAFFGEQAGFSNSAGSNNAFFGQSAGRINSASDNSFFGTLAGADNSNGSSNSFFGKEAGRNNQTGSHNSFFGHQTGLSNTTGDGNSFFGKESGGLNASGSKNSFFGRAAGFANTVGDENSFFGFYSGVNNSEGNMNAFLGYLSGLNNLSGSMNTLIGYRADTSMTDLTNATAIGAGAIVSQSNSLVLGSQSFGGIADTKVGIGISAPSFKLHINDSQNTGLRVETAGAGGTVASFGGNGNFQIDAPGDPGGRLIVREDGNVGIGQSNPNAKLQVAGGNVYIASPNSLIITSPNGACWFIKVSNTGTLSTLSVACP